MLDPLQLRRAVEMQQLSYKLLKWLAAAVNDGFIQFHTAHEYTTLPESAELWIREHYLNIPAQARPDHDDLPIFAAFFSTYLTNSFELLANPGQQRYSPDAHCFCPMCSWLVHAPRLKTRRVTANDKRRASRLQRDALEQLALDHQLAIASDQIELLLQDPGNRERAALIAYGSDLLQRTRGIATGPAILALWRTFAWTRPGSPKPGFQLTAEMILEAENRMIEVLREAGSY